MTCPICGTGSLRPGTTVFAADVDGTLVVVRDVPASVCDVCGEAYIDDKVSQEIETTINDARGRGTESLIRHYQPLAS
jgi:YgiT-type zinc finger domain-containing protein